MPAPYGTSDGHRPLQHRARGAYAGARRGVCEQCAGHRRQLQPRVPGARHRVLLGWGVGPVGPHRPAAQSQQPVPRRRSEPQRGVQASLPRRAAQRLLARRAARHAHPDHGVRRRARRDHCLPPGARSARRRGHHTRARTVTPAVVGFVGLGQMGAPMAANIVAAGYELVGFDVAGTDGRLPSSATAAGAIDNVIAGADTLFLSLPDGAATLAVVDGVIGASERRVRTVVDLSTVGPAAAGEAATRLGSVGVTYADGPVSGGVAGARRRTISLMFAGPDDVFADPRTLLEAFGGPVVP